jgi:hypothetical protein
MSAERSNRKYIYCDPETIDAAISGKTKSEGGLDKEQIQILMFEAGIQPEKVEFIKTGWCKPNRRKRPQKKKNSKALRKMLKVYRQVVLDRCNNPNQIYHDSWAASAAGARSAPVTR